MIMTLGVSHKTAPVAVREKVAFTLQEIPTILSTKAHDAAQELVLLSTCNRTEFYALTEDPSGLMHVWRHLRGLPTEFIENHAYHLHESEAVRHLMRVASGLDSMVVGEPQILSQLKTAYDLAHQHRSIGRHLQRLFQKSFMVAKAVRTETAISKHPVSVAYASVKLAQQIFSNLKKARVLLIGSGETIELVGRHLKAQGVQQETYANRSLERAQQLAQHLGGKAIPLSEVPDKLADFDIVLSAVGADKPILTLDVVERGLKNKKRHPIFMVDLGVPRNLDPLIKQHEDVYLYDLDDLQALVSQNIDSRQQEALLAESIIERHADAFMDWLQAEEAVLVIKGLRSQFERTKETVIEKAYQELALGHDPKKVVEYLAHRLTQKLLHHPSIRVKRAGEANEERILQAAAEIFNIE